MPDNKKHHFVPRFYLKRFSGTGKSISIYNIKSRRIIKAGNLSNQCYKDYFYGEDQMVEKGLASVEGKASATLNRLFTAPYSASDHMNLILYISTQHGRTNYAIETMREMIDNFTNHLTNHQLNKHHTAHDYKITISDIPQRAVVNSVLFHYLLLDLRLKILVTDSSSFITSDAPVVFYNQLFEKNRLGSNACVSGKGLQIFFPIDSRHLLLLYDKDVYAVGGRKSDIITELSQADIQQINGLQIASADQNVYFEDPSFPIQNLAAKYIPRRRKRKASLSVHPGRSSENEYSEYLATSIEDIKTELTLSFVRTLKRTRIWKTNFDKLNSKPVVIPRNEPLLRAHEQFVDYVRSGNLDAEKFEDWCHKKHHDFPILTGFKAS